MFSIIPSRSKVVKALEFDISEVESTEVAKELIISNIALIRRFVYAVDQPYNFMCQDRGGIDYISFLSASILERLRKLSKSVKNYGIETSLDDARRTLEELKKVQTSVYTLFKD